MVQATDFVKGQRVILSRVQGDAYRGKTGTVRRVVKRSNEVVVDVDGFDPRMTGSIYRADPENIDPAQ